MENRSHALMAGLFTLVLGLATVLSLYLFSERREDTRQVLVVTKENVSGLNPQAQVRYRGIRVGKVLDIRLDPDDVSNILILAEVEKLVPLTRGTTAKLSYQGVTGIAHVLLEDGGTDRLALAGDPPRIMMRPSLMDQLEDSLPQVLEQIQDFLANANQVMGSQNRQYLGRTLANLEMASGRMNGSLAQLQKLLSDENVAHVSAAVRESAPLMGETRKLVTQLQGVSARIEGILGEPASSPGGGDLMPRIHEMTVELTATSRQLNRVLQLLEEAPQSLVFGSPPGLPGPGEPGFSPPATPRP
ncbi:MlaD family protein [Azovibrio restrictus]|uniref:MlaD family protein n=1 Tax=Azovibrio restrictus TaxID=146938 RepID=UPI0026EEA4E5|nr:MlaD family protein [Azovibrio restrictus]